jgi:hypothetical protein
MSLAKLPTVKEYPQERPELVLTLLVQILPKYQLEDELN